MSDSTPTAATPVTTPTDWRIELVFVPVSDADRAKEFYASLGWVVDHDHRVEEGLRFVQITPPGSACSISFGEGVTSAAPGSSKNIQLVIPDAALAFLRSRGVEASGVEELAWGRFVTFADPDGNEWTLQELPAWSSGAGGDGQRPDDDAAPM
jgi:catechol 2,3-dioxygenase-like lactoylglutathione lyase family enzyme